MLMFRIKLSKKNIINLLLFFGFFYLYPNSSVFAVNESISNFTIDYHSYLSVSAKSYFNYYENGNTRFPVINLFVPLYQKGNNLTYSYLDTGNLGINTYFGFRKIYPHKKEIFGIYTGYSIVKLDDNTKSWLRTYKDFNTVTLGIEAWKNKIFVSSMVHKQFETRKTKKSINPTLDLTIGYAITKNIISYFNATYHWKTTNDGFMLQYTIPNFRIIYNYNPKPNKIFGYIDGVALETELSFNKTGMTSGLIGISVRLDGNNLENNFKHHMLDPIYMTFS